MIVKLIINKETLEVITEDGVTLNYISDNGTEIEIEVSKPDVVQEQTWQQ